MVNRCVDNQMLVLRSFLRTFKQVWIKLEAISPHVAKLSPEELYSVFLEFYMFRDGSIFCQGHASLGLGT